MYTVDQLACHVDGLSQREAASRFGSDDAAAFGTAAARQPPKRPKLADIIDRILEEDRTVP